MIKLFYEARKIADESALRWSKTPSICQRTSFPLKPYWFSFLFPVGYKSSTTLNDINLKIRAGFLPLPFKSKTSRHVNSLYALGSICRTDPPCRSSARAQGSRFRRRTSMTRTWGSPRWMSDRGCCCLSTGCCRWYCQTWNVSWGSMNHLASWNTTCRGSCFWDWQPWLSGCWTAQSSLPPTSCQGARLN